MPNTRIGDYFRVSKRTHNARPAKRNLENVSPESKNVSLLPKRPAHSRYACLTTNENDTPQNLTSVKENNDENEKSCHSTEILGSESLSRITTFRGNRGVSKTKQKPPISVPTAKSKSVNPPAFERFKHLAERSVVTEIVSEPVKCAIDAAHSSLLSESVDLTQSETVIPPGLVLPHHLRLLLEMFQSCDNVVSMLHNRKEVCSFDKLRPAVQEIVRRNFEESHVAQFQTVYPMVYTLRYEKQLDKVTRQPKGNYVLVLTPNLRTDGTQIGHDSPSKGFLSFSGTRLIQRRNRFHRLLVGLVMRAHREFLINDLGVDPEKLPNDESLRRWHPRFQLESAVSTIHPSPLPIRPSEHEHKITSAREAVMVFQARALFQEADACERIANSKQCHIPSPKKVSTTSKPSSSTTVDGDATKAPVPSNLKGISQALLNKIRAKENERRLLTELTCCGVPEARRAIYFRLPAIITQVWTILRSANLRPVPMITVASRVADVHPSGLSTDRISEHLEVLLELAPCWIEKLNWVTAHLRLKDPNRPVKDVVDLVRKKVAEEGVKI